MNSLARCEDRALVSALLLQDDLRALRSEDLRDQTLVRVGDVTIDIEIFLAALLEGLKGRVARREVAKPALSEEAEEEAA